jgi:HAMP domain-containing protein
MRLWCRAGLACVLVVLAIACTSPPNKEMDQAQGAIDAARAAGADRYAPVEFAAATTALKSASDAVAQGDYRLALNHAIDSREQAQNAARVGADTRAKVRGDVERLMAEVNALITQVNAWIASPAAARTPRTRRTAQQVVTTSTAEVQKAGSAMQAEDYAGAQKLLTATKERLQKVLPAAPNTAAAQSTRRRK